MNTVKEKELLRDAFKQSNAIDALEGGVLSEWDLRLQEQITDGVISFDEAIAVITKRARESSANANA